MHSGFHDQDCIMHQASQRIEFYELHLCTHLNHKRIHNIQFQVLNVLLFLICSDESDQSVLVSYHRHNNRLVDFSIHSNRVL